MTRTYDDLRAAMRSWLNMEPDADMSLSELATEIVTRDRRRGMGGVSDSWIVALAEYIDRERKEP